MLRFIVIALVSFAAMEIFSYVVHRYVYHGLLWVLHRSHHTPRKGIFELNDVFPAVFALTTMALMFAGLRAQDGGDLLAASIGITAYGLVYFCVHDLYVHRRAKALRLRIPLLLAVKNAHAIHHRNGGEPYGLLLFFNVRDVKRETVSEDEAV